MTKLKASLGRLVQESASERAVLQTLLTKGADLKDKETIYFAAFHATLLFEEAAEQVEKAKRDTTVGARLGQIMVKKGMTAKDLVETWDTSGRGEISKDDFRFHCLELGVVAPTAEINELFCSLDADGGGSLDKHELRAALKQLEDEAYRARNACFVLQKHTMDLAEVMQATQSAWANLKKTDALLEEIAEADARHRRAAEKSAAAEAEKNGRNEVVQAAADSVSRRRECR
jgi:Ca2+-binding EF-hand superfamily protein